MAKNLKLKIKNSQLTEALSLGKISLKKEAPEVKVPKKKPEPVEEPVLDSEGALVQEEPLRIRAKSHSSFSAKAQAETAPEAAPVEEEPPQKEVIPSVSSRAGTAKSIEERLFHPLPDDDFEVKETLPSPKDVQELPPVVNVPPAVSPPPLPPLPPQKAAEEPPRTFVTPPPFRAPTPSRNWDSSAPRAGSSTPSAPRPPRLGPTGRHIKDLLPAGMKDRNLSGDKRKSSPPPVVPFQKEGVDRRKKGPSPHASASPSTETRSKETSDDTRPGTKAKEFRDVKPLRKGPSGKFDARDRQGLRAGDDEDGWRGGRRRPSRDRRGLQEEVVIRPTALKVRIPISIKDLAAEMKLKASELISKLFLQGRVVTLNDTLDDDVEIQLLGQEFGCAITIDTSEEERIRITDKTVREEVAATSAEQLVLRPPVVAFMGHVDHGKTSLIDAIRNSNRVAGEAGAITQHIGAFKTHTSHGDLTILDTPGHEAFTAMRSRGAGVTDIVVLVVAGDEGVKPQTLEALEQAKAANVTIVVAINKCDKPNFDVETVYRQLAEQNLLPEAWGGTTITVNCSAVTKEGIPALLEMLALQAEVLELKADPHARARGAVLESEMHKGMGTIATVLVQTGTLRLGDAVVFDDLWGRIKTMRNEHGKLLKEAGPSTPVEITGLSGLPEAGHEFIVVKNEKEAREIAEVRRGAQRERLFQQKKRGSLENLLQEAALAAKKTLRVVLRADVQGSLEALAHSISKIHSSKVDVEVISSDVGEISESDIQLAAVSKATIVGFHTRIESHAEPLIKELAVPVKLFDVIYHAVDGVKESMTALLDKIAQENETGEIEVRAVFKSSQLGSIAGCMVTSGTVHRNHLIRLIRNKEVIWKGTIASLKRVKEDVREVKKGLECGVLLNGFNDFQVGDLLQAYEITYLKQSL